MSAPPSLRPTKTRDEIAQAYSSPTWWYDVRGFFILTFAYRSTLWEQLRFFGSNMGARHLEVAVGTGTLFEMIIKWRRRKRLPEVSAVGVDYAESMLAGARRRFAKYTNVEIQHADVAALPYPDRSFDTVNVANALHCFPDVDGALRDMHRVLKSRGRMAANVLLFARGPSVLRGIAEGIDRWGIRKGILVTPYDEAVIRGKITGAGFRIERETTTGNTYNVLAIKR